MGKEERRIPVTFEESIQDKSADDLKGILVRLEESLKNFETSADGTKRWEADQRWMAGGDDPEVLRKEYHDKIAAVQKRLEELGGLKEKG